MLNHVLAYLRNYFPVGYESGTFKVENGSIDLPHVKEGQYFYISGSIFNDGVHQKPANGMTDEVFCGTVYALAIPNDLLSLVSEIEKWQEENGAKVSGPYHSESFGGYTYTLKSDANGFGASWQNAFASRLNIWRKI